MSNKILQMINEYEEESDFFGEVSENAITEAENRIEVNFSTTI
ncbi:hypothetical protein [Priestia endophytica]|nr:hypothetical protein [Priestia endophytica]